MGRKNSVERKPTFGDMPAEALWELGKTYALGAAKHGRENWRDPRGWVDVWDAMMRHMLQWRMGEDVSEDDKHYHMGAIAMRALWLLVYHLDEEQYGEYDDRVDNRQLQSAKKYIRRASHNQAGVNTKKKKSLSKKGEKNHGSKSNKVKAGDARRSVKR